MNAESGGKGQDFGIHISIDQSYLSRLWLHAGKQSVWRQKEAGRIDQNAVSEPVNMEVKALVQISTDYTGSPKTLGLIPRG